jgi:hypothetical protein
LIAAAAAAADLKKGPKAEVAFGIAAAAGEIAERDAEKEKEMVVGAQ